MNRQIFAVATLLLVAACGGGSTSTKSGLPEDAKIGSLSNTDMNTLCEWANGYLGSASLQCNFNVESPQQCVAALLTAPNCQATVSQYEGCAYAVVADACTAIGNPDCGAIDACGS